MMTQWLQLSLEVIKWPLSTVQCTRHNDTRHKYQAVGRLVEGLVWFHRGGSLLLPGLNIYHLSTHNIIFCLSLSLSLSLSLNLVCSAATSRVFSWVKYIEESHKYFCLSWQYLVDSVVAPFLDDVIWPFLCLYKFQKIRLHQKIAFYFWFSEK